MAKVQFSNCGKYSFFHAIKLLIKDKSISGENIFVILISYHKQRNFVVTTSSAS